MLQSPSKRNYHECVQENSKEIFNFFVKCNLKLSMDILIMSVRHVFAQLQFSFVKCSCSRRDGRKRIMFVFFVL